MDAKVAEARASSLADWDEWGEFEAANKEFWVGIEVKDATFRQVPPCLLHGIRAKTFTVPLDYDSL